MDKVLALATELLSGETFSDPDNVKVWREQVGKMNDTLATLKRTFDLNLRAYLETNGRDSLPGVDFFHSPKNWNDNTEREDKVTAFLSTLTEAFGSDQ